MYHQTNLLFFKAKKLISYTTNSLHFLYHQKEILDGLQQKHPPLDDSNDPQPSNENIQFSNHLCADNPQLTESLNRECEAIKERDELRSQLLTANKIIAGQDSRGNKIYR